MIRVLLVDDHMPLRAGTRALLREAADIEVVAEAARGAEALDLSARLQPDVVLLDIKLPDISGVDVARTLRHELPEIKVLILTAYDYEQYVRTLFAIGVHGYLLKSDSGLELIAAVRAVTRGEQVLSAEIKAHLARATVRSGVAAAGTLSEREREVLTLVGQGARNKEIAQRLAIKTSTVETYISNAMAKLDVHSRSEALRVAIQRGIIVLDT
jgi:DNA-binding NarL/FixJ family response regulator